MTSLQITTSYDVRVPMRDGVELAADIWRPRSGGPQHGVLSRTPYNKNNAEAGRLGKLFASRGYAFVMMDVRGRGDSDGRFAPYVNEAHDGVDAIQWLASQDWSSGKVATIRWLLWRAHPMADHAATTARTRGDDRDGLAVGPVRGVPDGDEHPDDA
jgi:hypothetical protein